jgi:phosphoribosylanthranilate isomerase
MKYDVHIYATVRVKVCGVEAESQVEAIKNAEANTNLHELFPYKTQADGTETEYAEEVTGYLVDEHGDAEYSRTRYYNADMTPQNITRSAGEKRTV